MGPIPIIPADFVMSRQMLHGVKTRAERTTADLHAAKAARHHDWVPQTAASGPQEH
jgi:hypothetical protein